VRNPYVTGSYVSGRRHYGRRDLIDNLLDGAGRAYWVVGCRRAGKTSLLRQLEHLTALDSRWRCVPLYWDMQGGSTHAALGGYLADAVRDCEERFASLGVRPDSLAGEDAVETLAVLRRAVLRSGAQLLLLCDETEVLIEFARRDPAAAQALHRQLTGGAGLRAILVSTRSIYGLHEACEDWPTSPFLAGFDMSPALGGLTRPEAGELITQSQAQVGGGVHASPAVIEEIGEHANTHPYLMQILCSRLFRTDGTLRPPSPEDLEVDPTLAGFLRYDFVALAPQERELIWRVHEKGRIPVEELDEPGGEMRRRAQELERLGHLRRVRGHLAIGNTFLSNWLSAERSSLQAASARSASDLARRAASPGREQRDAEYLIAQLNARRQRLVELELLRSRELLATSPAALAEIEQVQTEIGQLRKLLERAHHAG
jgi:hypothetical protein